LKASTRSEIEAAFATLVRDRAEALYVAGDTFFTSRRVQFATLAASYRIPASYPTREAVEAGGLMGYATDRVYMCRQVGAYTWQTPKGPRPRRPAGRAPDQVRVGDQHAAPPSARPRRPPAAAPPRRRGDRVSPRREFITLLVRDRVAPGRSLGHTDTP